MELMAEKEMKKDENETNMKKAQLESETEASKKRLEEETKIAKIKEEEKRTRLIILLTALGFFMILMAILLIFLTFGSMVCYGDACFGYQGFSSNSANIPKNRKLGDNGKLLLTGNSANKKDSKIKLFSIMASAGLATFITFILFDLTIQDRKMMNQIGVAVSKLMKGARNLLRDSSNSTRTRVTGYKERTEALARRYWNTLQQTEAVRNIVE